MSSCDVRVGQQSELGKCDLTSFVFTNYNRGLNLKIIQAQDPNIGQGQRQSGNKQTKECESVERGMAKLSLNVDLRSRIKIIWRKYTIVGFRSYWNNASNLHMYKMMSVFARHLGAAFHRIVPLVKQRISSLLKVKSRVEF